MESNIIKSTVNLSLQHQENSSLLEYSNPWDHYYRLVVTGLSLGILHVLAGPDHLSALGTCYL